MVLVLGGLRIQCFDGTDGVEIHRTLWDLDSGISLDPSNTNLYMDSGNPCTSDGVAGDGCSGTVLDLNPATGVLIWSFHVPDVSGDDDIPTQPLYANGNLYVIGKSGIFYCLNATNGAIIWQYNTGSSGDFGGYSSPALYNGILYFGNGDNYVYALNASNGTLVWRYKTGSLVTASCMPREWIRMCMHLIQLLGHYFGVIT